MFEFLIGAGVVYLFCKCKKEPEIIYLPTRLYKKQKEQSLLEMLDFSPLSNRPWKEIYLEEAKRAAYLGVGDLTGEKK